LASVHSCGCRGAYIVAWPEAGFTAIEVDPIDGHRHVTWRFGYFAAVELKLDAQQLRRVERGLRDTARKGTPWYAVRLRSRTHSLRHKSVVCTARPGFCRTIQSAAARAVVCL